MSNIVLIENVEDDVVTILGDEHKEYKIRVKHGLDQFREWCEEKRGIFLVITEDGSFVFSASDFTIVKVGAFTKTQPVTFQLIENQPIHLVGGSEE